MRLEPVLSWWILLLIFLPMIIVIFWQILLKRKNNKAYGQKPYKLLLLVISLLGIAIGIQVPGDRSPAGMLNLDVVFAVDLTASMAAEDHDGKKMRFEGVKYDLNRLVDKLSGARITLIIFDSAGSRVVSPFTTDVSMVVSAVDNLFPERSYTALGTDISSPVKLIEKTFKQAISKKPERGRILFYAGDGEHTLYKKPKSFSKIKPLIHGGAVLGYGTKQGGNIRETSSYYSDKNASKRYVRDFFRPFYSNSDNTNNPCAAEMFVCAMSYIDEGALRTIANDAGVAYQHMNGENQSIDYLVNKSLIKRVADSNREISHYYNFSWLFAVFSVLILLWWMNDFIVEVGRSIKKDKTYE